MSASVNARIARESLEAAFASDWKRLRETYAHDATMVGGGLDIRGAENMVALWRGCHEEERDLRLEILNVVADGEMVALEGSVPQILDRWLSETLRPPTHCPEGLG